MPLLKVTSKDLVQFPTLHDGDRLCFVFFPDTTSIAQSPKSTHTDVDLKVLCTNHYINTYTK